MKLLYTAAILVLTTVANTNLHGQTPTANPQSRVRSLPLSNDTSWTKAEWVGDDKPFQRIRAEINKAIEHGRDLDELRRKYKAAAQKNQGSPQAQFRWGYAVRQTFRENLSPSQQYENLRGVEEALMHAPFPKTYEYARLLFLIKCLRGKTNGLQEIGERLLRRNPKDYALKYHLIDVLRFAETKSKRDLALKYAEELISMNPKHAGYYSVLASVHTERWLHSGNSTDADKAIDAYKRYLQLAPPKAHWREQAESLIKRIEEEKARKAKKN